MRRAARHPSDIEYAAKAVTFAMTSLATLTDEQADHFVQRGYVAVPGCLDPELAQRWTDLAYRRLGYDPDDPATWSEEIVWMDRHSTAPVTEISPRGWGALCDVVGGEQRIDPHAYEIESQHFTTIDALEWSDAFIVNFRRGAGPAVAGAGTRYPRLAQGTAATSATSWTAANRRCLRCCCGRRWRRAAAARSSPPTRSA